jgi:hypothetical protein
MYPPASIITCIRRVELRLEMDDAGLAFLGRFASGALGFPNLSEVDIIILYGDGALYGDSPGSWLTIPEIKAGIPRLTKKLKAMAPIELTANRVTVSYEHACCFVHSLQLQDTWEMVILGKIFLKNGRDEKTRWKWYDQTDDTSKVDSVRRGEPDGKWPEGDFLNRIFQADGRKTVKIMEV